MALLATKRRVQMDRPALTTSIDATLACFDGSRSVSTEFAQDILLALGVLPKPAKHRLPYVVRSPASASTR